MKSLRRSFAILGLLGLGFLGYMVFNGSMTVLDAGIRAALIFVAVMAAARLADALLSAIAGSLERTARFGQRRRATD